MFSRVYTLTVKLKYTSAMGWGASRCTWASGTHGYACTACWAVSEMAHVAADSCWAGAILISGSVRPSGAVGSLTSTWCSVTPQKENVVLNFFPWLDHSSPSCGIWASHHTSWMGWSSSLRKRNQGKKKLPSLPNYVSSSYSFKREICCSSSN